MAIVTIITPTYNRANTLENLYKSLLNQTNTNFEWLIVDDGSTDETESIVSSFIKENKIKIRFVKKPNGGKHTAVNYGVKFIDTPLTMIVDSDDKLLENAVAEIEKTYKKYKGNNKVGSFTFLKVYSNGESVVPIEEDEFVANYITYRIKGSRPGDMAEVFKTCVLKEYPFPEFENERFLSEDVCWIEIAKKYDTVFVNKAVYECEYLEGGLTANDKPMKFASPLGSMMRGKQLMSKECGLKVNIKGAIIYNCYKKSVKSDIPDSLRFKGINKLIQIITLPFGFVFFKKWNR